MLTFNENGPSFSIQGQLFDVTKNPNNSQFLNSTQTFKFSASRGNAAVDNSLQASSIQSPSMAITAQDKLKELLPEVIEEEQYDVVPGEKSKPQGPSQGYFQSIKQGGPLATSGLSKSKSSSKDAPGSSGAPPASEAPDRQPQRRKEKEDDVDAMANDEDLSVYEDVDCEDSSEVEDSTLALDSGKNGSSLIGAGCKSKLSGYRLIKHMEDSR